LSALGLVGGRFFNTAFGLIDRRHFTREGDGVA
jgi:hypothetical protein